LRLVAVGISHHTAPVELREQLAVAPERVGELLSRLRVERVGEEGVLLSTCNRVELYAVPSGDRGPDELAGWLAESSGLRARVAGRHIYRYAEEDALKHLFRVACSLDSMVVGEPQIIGQVRDAYQKGVTAKAVGPVLRRVMDRALHVAKRVRVETDIGREAVSVGSSGVELARQVLGKLDGKSALLVGAGAHGKLVARAMLFQGLGELVIANRTFANAVALAELLGASAVHGDEIGRYLERVDVALTSTSAGRVLISAEMLAPIMRRRRYRPLVLIDLSVPRNIAPEVNSLEGVYRFDVDDLAQVAEQGAERRRSAAVRAEQIVHEEVHQCWRLLVDQVAHQRVGALSRRADLIRQAELDRALGRLPQLGERDRELLDAMTRAIVKKLMNSPLQEARALIAQGEHARLESLLQAMGVEAADPTETDG